MNLMQMIAMMKRGGNPQQTMLNMLEQQSKGNPMMQNLIQMARKGDTRGIENFARNISKERGIDFDTEFANFRSTFGL